MQVSPNRVNRQVQSYDGDSVEVVSMFSVQLPCNLGKGHIALQDSKLEKGHMNLTEHQGPGENLASQLRHQGQGFTSHMKKTNSFIRIFLAQAAASPTILFIRH